MNISWASMTRRTAISMTLLGMCLIYGCGRESKVQQIQRGVENVNAHAKDIEDASRASDGDKAKKDRKARSDR